MLVSAPPPPYMLILACLQAESFKNQLQRANSEITSLLRDKNNVSHRRDPSAAHQQRLAVSAVAMQLTHAHKGLQLTLCTYILHV